jgi:citrate synthase
VKAKEIIAPLREGSTAYDFLYMLNGERPGENAEKTMDICLIIHAEHGMNASTFTARAICSTQADIYSAVTGRYRITERATARWCQYGRHEHASQTRQGCRH